MNIRENIKAIAKRHGTTLEETAKRMGINKVTLYRNIAGNITLQSLEKIASAIGCNVSDFFLGSETTLICPYCGKPIYLHPSEGKTQQKQNK